MHNLHLLPGAPLLDVWPEIVRMLQDTKTWDFIANVFYAAALGAGGFVLRKFGLRLKKNATTVGELSGDNQGLKAQNEALKAENAALKAERDQAVTERNQVRVDYAQLQESYAMLKQVLQLSQNQSDTREKQLQSELQDYKTGKLSGSGTGPKPEALPAPQSPARPAQPTMLQGEFQWQ